MERIQKVAPEKKMEAVEKYLGGEGSLRTIAKEYGVHHSSLEKWIILYHNFGEEGFAPSFQNMKYPKIVREKAVNEYLEGNMSMHKICRKYKLRSISLLQFWIRKETGK